MAPGNAAEDADLDLPAYCTASVLVLGCGNPFMGDDGFGPAVAELLLQQGAGCREQGAGDNDPARTRHPAPGTQHPESSLCVINAGTGSRGMIFNLVTGPARPKSIIIVDALAAKKRPGELFWVDIESLSLEKAEDFSLHMTPASNMLYQLRELGVEIRILACEPKNLPEMMTDGLTPEVAAAVGPAAGMVLAKAHELLGSGTG